MLPSGASQILNRVGIKKVQRIAEHSAESVVPPGGPPLPSFASQLEVGACSLLSHAWSEWDVAPLSARGAGSGLHPSPRPHTLSTDMPQEDAVSDWDLAPTANLTIELPLSACFEGAAAELAAALEGHGRTTPVAASSIPAVDSYTRVMPEEPSSREHNPHKEKPDVPLPTFLSHDWSIAPLADEIDPPSSAALSGTAPPQSASESEACADPSPNTSGWQSPIVLPTPFPGTSGSSWLLEGMKAIGFCVYRREELLRKRDVRQGDGGLWRTLRLPPEIADIQPRDSQRDLGRDGVRMLRGSVRGKGKSCGRDHEGATDPESPAHYFEGEKVLDRDVPCGRNAESGDGSAPLVTSGVGSFLAAGGQAAREGWRSRYAAMPKGRGLTGRSAPRSWASTGNASVEVFHSIAVGIPNTQEGIPDQKSGQIDQPGGWREKSREDGGEDKKESGELIGGQIAVPVSPAVEAVPLYIGLNLERHAHDFHKAARDFSERLVAEFRVDLRVPCRTRDTTDKSLATPFGQLPSQLELNEELREVEASIAVKIGARKKLQGLTEHGGVDLGPITRALEDAHARAHALRERIAAGQSCDALYSPDIWEYESQTRWIRFSQEKAAKLARAWQSDRGLVVLNAGGENESEVDLVTMQQSIRKNGFIRRLRRTPSHGTTSQTSTWLRGSAVAAPEGAQGSSPFVWPRALHMTAFYLGGHSGPPGSLLPIGTRRALELEGTEWPVRPSHLVYAEGALLVAALEVAADGLPLDAGNPPDSNPPHATLLTQPPFAPALAGEVLVAARVSGLLAPTHEPGTVCAMMRVEVGGTKLNLYAARLPLEPDPLPPHGRATLGTALLDGRLESFWG